MSGSPGFAFSPEWESRLGLGTLTASSHSTARTHSFLRPGAVAEARPISAVKVWKDVSRAPLSVQRPRYMAVTLFRAPGLETRDFSDPPLPMLSLHCALGAALVTPLFRVSLSVLTVEQTAPQFMLLSPFFHDATVMSDPYT